MDDKPKDYSRDAFKGGFSAGYFGTVGSKEGWEPSSFVSSRSNRASHQPQKPVDFMDDEDIADLRASRVFAVRREYSATNSDSVNAFMALAQSAASHSVTSKPKLYQRIGDQIMVAMGWKPGQIDSQMSNLIAKAAKPNYHGVDYSMDLVKLPKDKSNTAASSTSLPDLGNLFARKPTNKLKKKKKNVNVQQLSFGDIDEDVDIIPKAKSKANLPGNAQARQPLSAVTSLAAANSRCHDGRLPLSGFVLAERIEPQVIEPDPQFTEAHKQPKAPEGTASRSKPDSPLDALNRPSIITAEQRQKLGIMEPPKPILNQPPEPPAVSNVGILSRFTAATATDDIVETKPSEKPIPSLKTVCRTVCEWIPSRLLCKRMNIAPPAQSLELEAESEPQKRKQAADYFNLNDTEYVWASDVQGGPAQTTQPRPDPKLLHSVFGSE
ncbi:hypothetical protein LPJ55_003002 [Coemansia sp. RSA 990]|nr:hypothetical protein LPJ55_003002 [Coemansia sp. RSA 990]